MVEISSESAPFALTLFIAATSPSSLLAIVNIRSALERFERHPFSLEIVEVFEQPLRALQNRILVTPTLLVQPSARQVVGDLGDANLLDYFLRSVIKKG